MNHESKEEQPQLSNNQADKSTTGQGNPSNETDEYSAGKGKRLFDYQNDPDTSIVGGISKRAWDEEKLEELLNLYANTLSRSLPTFDNVAMAARPNPHDGSTLAMLQFTYTTSDKNWFANLFAFPVESRTAILYMTCTYDNAFVRSDQFMDIAESITFNEDASTNDDKQE
ncbi:hypothetical protein OZX62_08865 [Bifidobacterium sp. ESL0690]|uniref:hypothetical protein n=1 Tax=Bifidobacterium sp. ESL0690 TaxID=2983214 RepID=UPI0023F90025|nr:hypothetical protein [Bifidobacterium sp. ESL0690]WEV46530.1 hypothetical protein OZX62_08865 [Bifidobacterium sp. ESL0690]